MHLKHLSPSDALHGGQGHLHGGQHIQHALEALAGRQQLAIAVAQAALARHEPRQERCLAAACRVRLAPRP